MRRRLAPLVVVIALISTGATCNQQTARHNTTIGLSTVTSTLTALQSFEKTAFESKTIAALTLDKHKAFNAKIVQIWSLVESATQATLTWKVGDKIPAQVIALADSIQALVNDATALLGVSAEGQAKISAFTGAGLNMMVLVAKAAGG